jgi:hypothetical protein
MNESTALGQATADLLRAVARFQLAQLGDETYGTAFTSRDLLACSARNLAIQVDRLPRDQRPLGWWPLVSHRELAEVLLMRLRQKEQQLESSQQISSLQEAQGIRCAVLLIEGAFGFSSSKDSKSSASGHVSSYEELQVAVYRDVLSKIRVRVMQVCDFDSTESAAPQDEAFAREMDELNTYVRELTDGMEL